jgi:hypothetical protein
VFNKGKIISTNALLCLTLAILSLGSQAFIPALMFSPAAPAARENLDLQVGVLNLNANSAGKSLGQRSLINDPNSLFRWVLAWWKDSGIACNIYLDATGEPSSESIKTNCGEEILATWMNTPACIPSTKTGTEKCSGLYLLFMGMAAPGEIQKTIALPKLSIKSEQINCVPWENCSSNPQLQFYIEGEIPQAKTHKLLVQIGNLVYTCKTQPCILDMPVTKEDGVEVSYWAESAPGVVLFKHTFKMRNIIVEDFGKKNSFGLLGNDWPNPVDTCANVWNMFPESSTLQSPWLVKTNSAENLETDLDYSLLAGRLIWHGYVDASGCENSGLLPNGAADECGMTKAGPLVLEWQNRFNQVIMKASDETRVPPRLIKGVIAQESQFWPLWPNKPEYGYGMMSEMGIDLLLNWNVDYFLNLCNQHYPSDQCQKGYSYLTSEQRSFLRGVCLLSVGTDEEFVLLANMLKASCAQTRQLVKNITAKEPEEIFTYETLWRISLGVYNVGSGCMGEALTNAWNENNRAMTWMEFNKHIPAYCETASTYFDKVVFYGATGLHGNS